MSIFDKQSDKTKKFQKVVEGKTKEEVRIAEEHLLKPENITEYSGSTPKHRSELASRCALIVFTNQAQQDLISEIFAVRTSVSGDTYITDISLLEGIAKMVKEGVYRIQDGRVVQNEPDHGETVHPSPENTIHSMEELQKTYFPKNVGKRCPYCDRKLKKKKFKWDGINTIDTPPEIMDTTNEDAKPKRRRRKLK